MFRFARRAARGPPSHSEPAAPQPSGPLRSAHRARPARRRRSQRWLELTNEQDWEQENPYVDCDSLAVRRPGCGSKDRGGWHQTLVLVAVLAGLVVVGTRVVYAARERPTGASQSGRDTPTGSEDQQ